MLLAADAGLPPGEAASLRGKVQWALCLGTAGRAALQPLTKRQYETVPPVEGPEFNETDAIAEVSRWAITRELRGSLDFLGELLAGSLPDFELKIDGAKGPPILLLSDAMWRPSSSSPNGYGRMAYLAWFPMP